MNRNKLSIFFKKSGFLSGFFIFSLLLIASINVNTANSTSADEVIKTIFLPSGAEKLPNKFAPWEIGPKHPKLDSTMAALAAKAKISVSDAINLAESKSLRLSDNRVHAQIITHAEGLSNATIVVNQSGGEVTGVSNNNSLIQCWLSVDLLETVAASKDVYFIRRPPEAILLEEKVQSNIFAGYSVTEALSAINVPAWHTSGYLGEGVKIGIIDGGFEGYTSLLGTDLPAFVTVKNFVDGETDTQVDGGGPHGTACAEVIHDIAPDAEFYLAKINTNLDLEEAVNWLKDDHHVDIISTSLGWYNVTPGDGTGEFADLVFQARNAGILWVTAASNDRQAHWGGLYSDPNNNNIHNFNVDQDINYFGPGDGSAYYIDPGRLIQVYVRWDDWINVDQDYNLWLLRWNGLNWDVIGWSENFQNGNPGQTPTEAAYAITTGSPTAYGFIILRYNSTREVNLEIFTPKVSRLDELLHARSISNLADAPDAVTVAALDVNAPYDQEPYSSEGPTNGPDGTETGGFIKPDISGYANVSTESYLPYLPYKFNGTSAATPHVAGAAALVLSAYPTYTPEQIQNFMENKAIDMGQVGKDNQYGHGRLYLGSPSSLESCDGDFNLDNDVDGSDLVEFSLQFNSCTGTCSADFNDDGIVDNSDLGIFANNFGKTDCSVSP